MKKHRMANALAAVGLMATAGAALAQKTSIQAIEEYREMLQDGNPADLFEAKGEELWKQQRGPKNASLQQCDLGKGPGVVKGAFVELPRYFADTGKVQITYDPGALESLQAQVGRYRFARSFTIGAGTSGPDISNTAGSAPR